MVFSITLGGTHTVLHRFKGGSDGADPEAGLINVQGKLYGTTSSGGTGSCNGGCGTVFSITTSGKEKVLYAFKGGSDGAAPSAGLINVNGTFYGTTVSGGTYEMGTVFSITPNGTESVLYAFQGGSDGNAPYAGLINVKGTLYGTTGGGGGSTSCGVGGCGTVFSIKP